MLYFQQRNGGRKWQTMKLVDSQAVDGESIASIKDPVRQLRHDFWTIYHVVLSSTPLHTAPIRGGPKVTRSHPA